MKYPINEIQQESLVLMEAVLPGHVTPPVFERRQSSFQACTNLGRLATESCDDIVRGVLPADSIIPLGIYATRSALISYIDHNKVDRASAIETSNEVADLCSMLQKYMSTKNLSGDKFGLYAELGVLNMAWQGIADGQLPLEHAFLLGLRGHEDKNTGLRRDTDLVVKPTKNGRPAKAKKIQVKASDFRLGYVYDPSIAVISAEGLFNGSRPSSTIGSRGAVAKLMDWQQRVNDKERGIVYRNFVDSFASKPKKKQLVSL
jgi:hypothetical protein